MLVSIGAQTVNTEIIAQVVSDDTQGKPCLWIQYQRESVSRGQPDTRIEFPSTAARDAALEQLYRQAEQASAASTPAESDPVAVLEQLSPEQRHQLFAQYGYISAHPEALMHYLGSISPALRDKILAPLGVTGSEPTSSPSSPSSPQVEYRPLDTSWTPDT